MEGTTNGISVKLFKFRYETLGTSKNSRILLDHMKKRKLFGELDQSQDVQGVFKDLSE